MVHIELSSPEKNAIEREPKIFRYDYQNTVYLSSVKPYSVIKGNENDFFQVIEKRKSRRQFNKLPLDKLSATLWHLARVKDVCRENSGFLWQHRNVPSAGGRHPIDILLYNTAIGPETLFSYDGFSHALHEILIPDVRIFQDFRQQVKSVFDNQYGTVIWLVAQFEKTMSKYKNGESLVWLDAGAILASLYYICQGLKLSGCAIGITGEPYISSMFRTDLLKGTCGFVIGT